MSSSKLSKDVLNDAIAALLYHSLVEKKRKFTETVDLHISLKNYDKDRDKKFMGTVKLKHMVRPKRRFAVLGDDIHCDEAKANGVASFNLDSLRTFNKNKKEIKKKLLKRYDVLLASDVVIKHIPRLLGPSISRAGKFPILLTHEETLPKKMEEVRSTVKFQMKKVNCLSVAVGHVQLTKEELASNIITCINFLVSLLKKNWQNVKRLHVATTMGKAYQIY